MLDLVTFVAFSIEFSRYTVIIDVRSLSYLYIKNIERPLNNIEINFSSLFNFSFEESIHRLHIEKKDDSQIDRTKILYGDNIDNIKLLIGKNGTGKTTIMQLLGLDSQTRLSEFKTHKAVRKIVIISK